MPDDFDAKALRTALLEQLSYLGDEVEALKALIGRVPEPVLEGRPLEADRSIKELFGLLAARDRELNLPFVEQVVAEDEPRVPAADDDRIDGASWNEQDIAAILEEVSAARQKLVAAFRALPVDEWQRGGYRGEARRTLFELAHEITQADSDVLRTISYRLHESQLTPGAQGPPK